LTTKIHLLADALGRPLRFLLTGGQVHESRTAEAMLHGVEGDAVIADKAYDSNAIRAHLKAAGMKAVIPSKLSRRNAFGTTKPSTASATASSAVSTN
jgi:transposase